MRLESHYHRLAAQGVSTFGHVPYHLLVGATDAVEVSHADQVGPKFAGTLRDCGDLHYACCTN